MQEYGLTSIYGELNMTVANRITLVAGVVVALLSTRLASADIVIDWNNTVLEAIRKDKTPPPKAARAMAMMHIAMYDSIQSIRSTHKPFMVSAEGTADASAEAAACQAARDILVGLYPDQKEMFDDRVVELLGPLADDEGFAAGREMGSAIAERVLELRTDDGSSRTVEHPGSWNPGEWKPTAPHFRAALLPQWGDVKTFALHSGTQFKPIGPPEISSGMYARDWLEVRNLGLSNSQQRTDEQSFIAEFWEGGQGTSTPAGQWNMIAQTISNQQELPFEENARLFAMLNVTLADSGISCWNAKYRFNFWRPIDAIREADTDDNDSTHRDADWRPLLDTPPFPSCTSGHSTFSGAAAESLAQFFGTDEISFTAMSEDVAGERQFTSLQHAAEEAGRSRIFGGIHYDFENVQGLAVGKKIAEFIADNYFQADDTAAQEMTLKKSTESDAEVADAGDASTTVEKAEAGTSETTSDAAADTPTVVTYSIDPLTGITTYYGAAPTTTTLDGSSIGTTTTFYGSAPQTTTYYGSAPTTTTYYGAAPTTTTFYGSTSPVTVYYAPAQPAAEAQIVTPPAAIPACDPTQVVPQVNLQPTTTFYAPAVVPLPVQTTYSPVIILP